MKHSDFMQIVGLNLRNVSASIEERKSIEGNINVNSSPVIVNVEKKSTGLQGLKDVISIEFRFEIKYSMETKDKKKEKMGEMIIVGDVFYYTEKEKELIEKWKKEKKLEDSVAVEVLNAIFRRCLTVAIGLSNELKLPPPIKFPTVKSKEQSEYIG